MQRELIPMTQATAPPAQPLLQTKPAQQLMLTEDNILELAAAGWTKEDADAAPAAATPAVATPPRGTGDVPAVDDRLAQRGGRGAQPSNPGSASQVTSSHLLAT